ncbi:MAG: YwaF family protein [Bacilli bacterium]|nr:YwaF family protein [Bacilli bacterium]MBN2877158.1 YwaF family protein [Bacilli bacterium]
MSFFSRIPLGGEDEFLLFTPTYFIALIISLILIYFVDRYSSLLKNKSYEKWIRYGISIYLLYSTINIYTFFIQNHLPWFAYIPEGICGLSVFLVIYVFLTKKRSAFVLLFFWGWGAFMALFAPNILEGPDRYFFYQFYLRHLLIILGPIYMMRVFDYKVYRCDYKIYVIITLPLSLLGLIVSYWIHDPVYGNLFYMMRPVIEGTPLDYLYNIHPFLYTGVWILIAFLFGYVYGLPFYQDTKEKSEFVTM